MLHEEKLVLQQNGKLLYRTEANHSVQYDYGSASLESIQKKVAAVVERWAKERVAGDPDTPTRYLNYNNTLISGQVWTEFDEVIIGNNTCYVSQRLLKNLPTAYQNYHVYALQANFNFTAREDIDRSIFSNTVTIRAQFLQSNGNWGSSFEVVNTSKNTYSGSIQTREQGFYLITEQDVIGNIEQYIVYLDKVTPSIKAVQMSIANGEEVYKDLILDELWYEKYMATARFIGLRLVSLLDNDSYCVLEINGRNIDGKRYVIGDTLPDLTYENGYYGQYTLSAYDRTGNKRDYVVNIAGAPTQVTHTSLTNEVRCKITIDVLDQTNELIELKIQKSIYFEGGIDNQKLIDITVDNLGTVVNVINTEYTFTEGGKYILTFRDIYGRQEMYEIFYLKGLPQAQLVGVKVGGTTNGDVSCIYDDVETAILYKQTESGWVVVNDVYTYDTGNNTRTTTITATSGEYTTYKFLVYVTADRNLFSEYKFKIKKRLPTVTVKDLDGNDIELNGITNKQFTIDWDDYDVHVDYSRSANKFNTSRYYRGEIFGTRVGTFYFDVSDSVGNTTSFSITFDNVVDYSIKGNYKLING